MSVFVEAAVLEEKQIRDDDDFNDIKSKLYVYKKSKCKMATFCINRYLELIFNKV